VPRAAATTEKKEHFANVEENTLKNQYFRKMLEHFAKC
jgi:hypothetical protein